MQLLIKWQKTIIGQQMPEHKQYSYLAGLYGHLMRSVDYLSWAEYIASIIEEYSPEPDSILELAAGNGTLTKFLSRYFKNVIMLDQAAGMLAAAKKLKHLKVCADMRKLPFNSKFHVVICTFDSINYLLTEEDVIACFKEVREILDEEGIFTFDVSLEKNSLAHVKVKRKVNKYEGTVYEQISKYNVVTKIHTNKFYITTPEGETFEEVHEQRIYPFETYFELIDRAGLYVVDCYEAFSVVKGRPDSKRIQFITKKNNASV